mgnify:CR=1 FL=1
MTIKTLLCGIISTVLLNACVSKKVFTDLEEKYKLLKDKGNLMGLIIMYFTICRVIRKYV